MAQTVLVADDSVASQRLFEMVLTREGFEVVTVGSGAEVLRRVKEKQPDLALIDAVMPGVDGYQICQSLKKDPACKNLPIIMLAGAYEDVDRQRGAAIVGARAILDKPATSQVIIAKVKEFLTAAAPAAKAAIAPAVAAQPVAAEVVQEPSFVDAEYAFEEDSEEIDLAVESELLEEEAEWEETDEEAAEFPEDLVELDESEEAEESEGIGSSAKLIEGSRTGDVFAEPAPVPQTLASHQTGVAARPMAISDAQLDAVAEEIAKRVAAKLGPALLRTLTAHVLQLPAVRHIVEETSKSLVQEILPEIQDSFE